VLYAQEKLASMFFIIVFLGSTGRDNLTKWQCVSVREGLDTDTSIWDLMDV